jgi:GR25 family glycosyltransferase involved in LPS biosynthesis
MGIKGYVLTIDPPSGLRRRHISRVLNQNGLAWQFVEGIRTGDPSLSSLYSWPKNLFFSKKSMALVEVAVYAGHRRIWRTIANSSEPYALVFEDDAVIANVEAFERALTDLVGVNFDLVKLFDFKPKAVAVQINVGQTQLVSHRMVASGLVCYLISRETAQKLLNRPSVFRAVDEDISHPWEFGIRIWSVWPNPVTHCAEDLGGSLVESHRRAKKKNPLRSIYAELLQLLKRMRTAAYHAKVAEHPFR